MAAKPDHRAVQTALRAAATPGHFGAGMLAEAAGFKVEPIHCRATGDAITATTGYLFAASRAAASAALKVLLGRITAFTFSLSAMK